MALYDEILKRVKDEITKDPLGLGYVGKTNAEILQLLNGDVHKEYVATATYPPRINSILEGLAGAPNIVALQDVANAKNLIT